MNNLVCQNCGGPLRTTYLRCPYCGSSIDSGRSLSGSDQKRLSTFATIIDQNLWKSLFRYRLYIHYIIVSANIILMFLFTSLLHHLSGSILIPAISMLLMAVLTAGVYFSLNWFSTLYESLMRKVYLIRITPVIEHFLGAYNYFGCELERIIHEEKLEMREVIPGPVDKKAGSDRADAFITFINVQIQERLNTRRSRLTVIIDFSAAYLLLLTFPLYLNFFPLHWQWVPFLWVAPGFVYLFLNVSDKMPGSFLDYRHLLTSFPDSYYLRKELLPLVKKYCEFTGLTFAEIISRSYSWNRPVLEHIFK